LPIPAASPASVGPGPPRSTADASRSPITFCPNASTGGGQAGSRPDRQPYRVGLVRSSQAEQLGELVQPHGAGDLRRPEILKPCEPAPRVRPFLAVGPPAGESGPSGVQRAQQPASFPALSSSRVAAPRAAGSGARPRRRSRSMTAGRQQRLGWLAQRPWQRGDPAAPAPPGRVMQGSEAGGRLLAGQTGVSLQPTGQAQKSSAGAVRLTAARQRRR